MPSISDFAGLSGNVVIESEHVGDIVCHTLTVTRQGMVRGNIVCDTLQNGGHIEGIAVCRHVAMNSYGRHLGSIYYKSAQLHGVIRGSLDDRDPSPVVWALVAPDHKNAPVVAPEVVPVETSSPEVDTVESVVKPVEITVAVKVPSEEAKLEKPMLTIPRQLDRTLRDTPPVSHSAPVAKSIPVQTRTATPIPASSLPTRVVLPSPF